MLLFTRSANLMYHEILKNGPFIPLALVHETTNGSEVNPTTWAPKDPSLYIHTVKEKVSLDNIIMIILIESLDLVMYNNIVKCKSTKHIWKTVRSTMYRRRWVEYDTSLFLCSFVDNEL